MQLEEYRCHLENDNSFTTTGDNNINKLLQTA